MNIRLLGIEHGLRAGTIITRSPGRMLPFPLLAVLFAGFAAAGESAGPPAGQADGWDVRTRFTASGSLRAAVGAVPGETAAETTATTLEVVEHAVAAEATLQYLERPAAGAVAQSIGPTAVRQYHQAEARLKIAGTTVHTALPADARKVLVTAANGRLHPWLPDSFVTRAERDLLVVPFDPAWQDLLRPPPAAGVETSWTLATEELAGLLCIDTVTTGSVMATVERIEEACLVISLEGGITGGVDGVPTSIDLTASYRWDASAADGARERSGLITLTARMHEQRQAGHVTPGLNIEAVIETTRRWGATAAAEPEEAPAEQAGGPCRPRRGPGRPGSLWLTDPRGRFDLVYDARWRPIQQQADQTVLRLIDRGRLLGQVSIIPLPPAAESPSLAAFQRDIERSLDGQFNHLVVAAESVRSNGTRILRVASDGEADGLPFRWIHYHLTGIHGTPATLSFMVESGLLERFGEADQLLVDGFTVAGAADRPLPAPPNGKSGLPPGMRFSAER